MNKSTKYTKDRIEEAVKKSVSLAETIRNLGIKWSGGQQQNLKRWIKIYELDTSHFFGQAANRGEKHVGGAKKKHWSQRLVLRPDNNRRESAYKLRRALIESGREYKCEGCGNEGEWQGKPLMLQVDHNDGNWNNNTKENLKFMCPNCHTQTEGWSGSKGGSDITSTAKRDRERRKEKKLGL